MVGGLERDDIQGPFQPKPFYDSIKSMHRHGREWGLAALSPEEWQGCACEMTKPENIAPWQQGDLGHWPHYSSAKPVTRSWHKTLYLFVVVITLLKQISLRLSNHTIHKSKLTLYPSTNFLFIQPLVNEHLCQQFSLAVFPPWILA